MSSSSCLSPKSQTPQGVIPRGAGLHRAPAAFSRSPLLCPRQASRTLLSGRRVNQYIPPIPPPAPARAGFSSFLSTTTHSVVSRRPAIDAAFCSAVRVTLVGSITARSRERRGNEKGRGPFPGPCSW